MSVSPAEALRELQRRERMRRGMAGGAMRFREFCEAASFCALVLSPLMGAIADAADGISPSCDPALVARHFGCAELPTTPRRTVCIRSGGRSGKSSRLIATKALHAAWTCELPTLAHGEVPSSLIVAPDLKLARQTLSFVKGYVEGSEVLRSALTKPPTADAVELRRHDGRVVRVEVLAATRGGRAVRARTLCFAGLDEACFFFSADTGIINDQDIYNAVHQRVVPGGQTWLASTPWLAGVGILEQRLTEDWGRHEHALCITAPTRALNPNWDPEGIIERDLRAQDPDAARREIDGEPLVGGAATFFDPIAVDACVDASLSLPHYPSPGEEVTAGADFGFRSDGSALCVVHRRGRLMRVAELLERRPEGAPLKPSETVRLFAKSLVRHAGLSYVVADSHYRESVTEHLADCDLGFKPAPLDIPITYIRARALMREGRVRFPKHPRLIAQLKSIQWRPNAGGSITIILPRDKTGHCDLAAAFVLALWEAGGMEATEPKPAVGSPEAAKAMQDELERLAVEDIDREVQEREDKW